MEIRGGKINIIVTVVNAAKKVKNYCSRIMQSFGCCSVRKKRFALLTLLIISASAIGLYTCPKVNLNARSKCFSARDITFINNSFQFHLRSVISDISKVDIERNLDI